MDYRFTLNLPDTNFSMKANLSKTEISILKFWTSINLYENQKNKEKLFTLNDGPPYANGDIHIGHAFNKILKDIICKFKFLDGYKINFIPGWDCHGLPIELNVEKSILNSNKSVSNLDFRLFCKNYADEQIDVQRKSFMRLGINADWNNFYKTMDYSFELSIVESFKTMFVNGYIYGGVKPVYWCFNCSSALAEAEIEYDIKNSDSIYVFFEIFFDKFFFNEWKIFNLLKIGFVIWTTTPWTLPFNEGVALNHDADYLLISLNKIGYILDKNLLEEFIKKISCEKTYIILNTYKGKKFSDLLLLHPFYNKKIKILYSDHVRGDSGTGCVHIAPAYGYDDYKVALVYNLPIKNSIDNKGFFHDDVLNFEGIYFESANKLIIDSLKFKCNLLYHEVITHRYPFCWRHKTVLIFRTTKQWFLDINKNNLKTKLLHVVSELIKWIPGSGKSKMLAMLSERPDWCISRQRLWGVPIIFFINKFTDEIHPNMHIIIEKSLIFIKKYGVSFWYEFDIFDLFSVDKNIYYKVNDVLDVWFDSSVVYKYMKDHCGLNLPIDLCVEGSDQYRGWFQVSLINSIANYGIIPYKNILTHGFILDSYGRKMSKSLNNVISPNDVVDKYGADILRLWVSSVNYKFDVHISEEIINRICEAYRKFRNTFRFLLSNLYDLDLNSLQKNSLLKIDYWIINKFFCLKFDILNDYSDYKFYFVYKKLYNFCVEDLGSKYLDLIKDRLYTMSATSVYRKSVQSVLFYVLYGLIKLIAPILSFTSEEVWKNLIISDAKSIFLSNFNSDISFIKNLIFFDLRDFLFWDKIFLLKLCVNKFIEDFRKSGVLGSSLEVKLCIFCNIYWYDLLLHFKYELHLFFLVSEIKLFINLKKKEKYIFSGIDGVYLKLKKISYIKCERCWHRKVKILDFFVICERCIDNLYYNGETRFLI